MKKRLSFAQTVTVGSMLFGLFFGAGNLIFPVFMGQSAGSNIWPAVIGFIVTGVGVPLLGVAAMGMSQSSSLLEMSSHISPRYGLFFTCALYLTIGPFFAIPRCASTAFSVGLSPLLPNGSENAALCIFALLFFAAVLAFSLKPTKILTWVGKILTPLFLLSLGLLIVTALLHPMGSVSAVAPQSAYQNNAFFKGFLEGYNTMDALAGLAFGIVVIEAIKALGVTKPEYIAGNTVWAGLFGCLLMAVIYFMLTVVGAQSRALYPLSPDGGAALNLIATHYFKGIGGAILAVIVTLACLKTAVGLITSCGEMFCQIFPKGPSYKIWAILFCTLSFLISTMGLNAIIAWSLPVLMFLYPLSITLILLSLCGKLFHHSRAIYVSVTAFTAVAAFADFLRALPYGLPKFPVIRQLIALGDTLPFSHLGLGWVTPALLGFVLGLVWCLYHSRKKAA